MLACNGPQVLYKAGLGKLSLMSYKQISLLEQHVWLSMTGRHTCLQLPCLHTLELPAWQHQEAAATTTSTPATPSLTKAAKCVKAIRRVGSTRGAGLSLLTYDALVVCASWGVCANSTQVAGGHTVGSVAAPPRRAHAALADVVGHGELGGGALGALKTLVGRVTAG